MKMLPAFGAEAIGGCMFTVLTVISFHLVTSLAEATAGTTSARTVATNASRASRLGFICPFVSLSPVVSDSIGPRADNPGFMAYAGGLLERLFVSIRLSAYLPAVMGRLGAADLEAVLSFLEEAQTVKGPVPFTREILDRLKDIVGCRYATYSETHRAARTVHRYVTGSADSDGIPDSPASEWWDCPRTVQLLRYKAADSRPFAVLANVFSRRQRTSPRFNGNYRDYGAADEFQLDLDPTRPWFASLSLADERDFGPREKQLLELLRPHLAALYRSAVLRRQFEAGTATFDRDAAFHLTPRERDVMALVARGLSNIQIANTLVVEVSTVRKHLEHVYDKLGVRSRTAAVAELRA